MTAALQLVPGEIFAGKYRVDRLVKAGGMGAVYAALHTATMRKVALKIMRPEIVADPTARERFTREAQVSARIESVHCVDVLDAGIDPATGIPFLVMELLVGKELGELLAERGRFAPGDVVQWLGQAARALDRAHAGGIVHRDLKPENLFLAMREGEAPTIKVLDFGIARILEGATNRATMAAGTPLYMAPEQTSRSAAIGPHTDVWALGLTAYTFLVGRPYWQGADLRQLYGEIIDAPMEPPTQRAARLGVQLPGAFDAWFFRCVERDPQRRAARAGEAIRALGDALGASLAATPAPPSPAAATMMAGVASAGSAGSAGSTAWAPPPAVASNPAIGGTAMMAAPPAYAAAAPLAHPAHPVQIPPHPGAGGSPRARSGAPGALLAVLGLIALVAIGGGVYLALGGSGAGTSTTAGSATATASADEPTEKPKKKQAEGDDDDSPIKTAKPSDPKPVEPLVADPDPASAPTAESALHAAPPKPPVFVAPKPTAPPPPPPPKMNCSPGVVNDQGRCTCPAGFRSVGPSGSARCAADDPADDPAP